jgi:hypothetical protein
MCSLPTDSNKYFIAARSANCTERKDTCVFACEDMRIIKSKNTTRLTIKNKSRIQKKKNGRKTQKFSKTRNSFNKRKKYKK